MRALSDCAPMTPAVVNERTNELSTASFFMSGCGSMGGAAAHRKDGGGHDLLFGGHATLFQRDVGVEQYFQCTIQFGNRPLRRCARPNGSCLAPGTPHDVGRP